MPRLKFASGIFVVGSLLAALWSPLAMAQNAGGNSAENSIRGVMAICTPVIAEEYDGDRDRWLDCVNAVDGFLKRIGAPSDETNDDVADLVAALTELYEIQLACPLEETELPQAIALAADYSTDDDQQIQILEISATIKECDRLTTAAILVPASAF